MNAKAEDNIEINGPHVLITQNPLVVDILAKTDETGGGLVEVGEYFIE
jgi:hypothetical protein